MAPSDSVSKNWLSLFNSFLKEIRIDSKETGIGPLNPYNSQTIFLNEIASGLDRGVHEFVCLKARQLGISTMSLAIDLFWLFMHEGLQGALVTDTDDNRDKFRVILNRYLQSLPRSWRVETRIHNRTQLVLSNGSVLDYVVAGVKKGRGQLGRSRAWNFIHATECSSYGDQEAVDSLVASLAQNNPDRLYIFESTARGPNAFCEMWDTAEQDPTKHRFFIGWWAKEDYSIKRSDRRYKMFMEDELTDYEREMIAEVKKTYKHHVSDEQLAWYRWYRDTHISSEAMMEQEFPFCVVAGTRVGTDRGLIPIEEASPGDEATLCEVEAAGPTREAPIFTMKTALGYEVCGTHNHPLKLAEHGFVDLGNSTGHQISLLPPRLAAEPCEGITPDFARFVGLFMGDGSMSATPRSGAQLSMACDAQDQDLVEEIERLIRDLFHANPRRRQIGKCTDIRVSSQPIHRLFKHLQLVRTDTGKTQRHVHVPEFIFRSPPEIVREFLRGLFEADGFNCFAKPRVVLYAKDPDFLRDVQLLLLAFGITCRRVDRPTRTGDFHYVAHELNLRSNEAIAFNEKIGFLSARKSQRASGWKAQAKAGPRRRPMLLQDQVASVTPAGRAMVYNLTVSGDHLFDANGILTHNTADQAFIVTGRIFFPPKKIVSELKRVAREVTFKGYRYHVGEDFRATTLEQVRRDTDADLRIFEEPVAHGVYAIGCDPAYGSNEYKDSHTIEILRCYADRTIQVAELATPDVETYQLTWFLAHLAGAYRNCIINLEIIGPGAAVMTEFRHLKQLTLEGRFDIEGETGDWRQIFANARWYMYNKPDSMGSGFVLNWKTNSDNKQMIMNKLRDEFSQSRLRIQSRPALREMEKVVQDGSSIVASGRGKDDRVMGLALANEAYTRWLRPGLISNEQTWKKVSEMEAERGKRNPVGMVPYVVEDFFKRRERDRFERELETY